MNLRLTNPSHWRIMIQSAIFLVVALALPPTHSSSTRPRVVFFSAVYRPTIVTLMKSLIDRYGDQVDVIHCSFQQRNESEKAELPPQVRWLTLDTVAGARAVTGATVVVTADRLRTLGFALRFGRPRFIDVWHGISFKTIKRASFLARYDEVWVASEALARLYRDRLKLKGENLRVMGFSPADRLFDVARSNSNEQRQNPLPTNILFAPTWTPRKIWGKSKGPLWEDYDALQSLANELDVTFTIRSHFLSEGSGLDRAAYSRLVFVPQSELPNPSSLLEKADVLIADWSSLAFEYLATNRPVIFIENRRNRPRRFLVCPDTRWGPVVNTVSELRSELVLLKSNQERASKLRESSERAREDFFPSHLQGQATSLQVERLARHLGISK